MDWLKDSVTSGYVIFFLTLFQVFLPNWFVPVCKGKTIASSKEKQGQASLISMPPDAHNRLEVVYKGKRTRNIDDLHQTSFKIYSTGEQPVQNVKCQIAFEDLDSEDLLEVTIEDTIPEETREAKQNWCIRPMVIFLFHCIFLF